MEGNSIQKWIFAKKYMGAGFQIFLEQLKDQVRVAFNKMRVNCGNEINTSFMSKQSFN
jgi:hypothetical protein